MEAPSGCEKSTGLPWAALGIVKYVPENDRGEPEKQYLTKNRQTPAKSRGKPKAKANSKAASSKSSSVDMEAAKALAVPDADYDADSEGSDQDAAVETKDKGGVNKAPMSSNSTTRFDAAPRKSNETTPEQSSKRKQATQPPKPKKPRVHQQAKFSKHCQGLDKANGTHDQCIFSTKSTGQPAIGNYDQKCVWCNPEATQQASALQHNNLVDTDEEFFNQIEADLLS